MSVTCHFCTTNFLLLPLIHLLHLQAEQTGLGAAWSTRIIAILVVECVAAFVESLDNVLTFSIIVVVPRQTVC